MSSCSIGSSSASGMPGQPIHAPRRRRSSGSKRGDQAARAPFPRRAAVGQPLHVDGQPVGHHDEVGVPGAGPWPPPGVTYASSFAGPMPSMDRKIRHSSASFAYAATTRLAWRAVLSASGSTSPSSAGSDFAGMTTTLGDRVGRRGRRRPLRARTDGRTRHRLRPHSLLFFGQADALAGVVAGAGDAVDRGQVGVSGDAAERRVPEFGTVCGTQMPVYRSSSSPAGHWASGTDELGSVKTAIAGAAATATANPPARISRRTESSRVAIVTLSVVSDLLVGRILWKLKEICIRSTSSLRMRPLRLRIGPFYGLALMVERGTGCGPASASFSARPMHAPELRPPVHGTPSISGMSGLAAVVVNPWGELGTRNGVQEVVNTSSSSPESHAARGLNPLNALDARRLRRRVQWRSRGRIRRRESGVGL